MCSKIRYSFTLVKHLFLSCTNYFQVLLCGMDKQPLTDKQQQVLTAIERNQRTIGPTVRQLATLLKCSQANVQQHIQALRRKGWL